MYYRLCFHFLTCKTDVPFWTHIAIKNLKKSTIMNITLSEKPQFSTCHASDKEIKLFPFSTCLCIVIIFWTFCSISCDVKYSTTIIKWTQIYSVVLLMKNQYASVYLRHDIRTSVWFEILKMNDNNAGKILLQASVELSGLRWEFVNSDYLC